MEWRLKGEQNRGRKLTEREREEEKKEEGRIGRIGRKGVNWRKRNGNREEWNKYTIEQIEQKRKWKENEAGNRGGIGINQEV